MEPDGKVALITGGGRGIGAASARLFARHGINVVVNDLDTALGEAVAREIISSGGKAIAIGGDVRYEPEVRAIVNHAVQTFGTVDILLNNAGMLRPTRVAEISEEEYDLVVDVNMKGCFLCSREVIPLMKKSGGGRIINMS